MSDCRFGVSPVTILILILILDNEAFIVTDKRPFFRFQESLIDPSHEIMALFVLHKLILQTCLPRHPVGLDSWFLVGPFVYFHTLCVWAVNALGRLRGCAGSLQHSLVTYVISTIISWAGSIDVNTVTHSWFQHYEIVWLFAKRYQKSVATLWWDKKIIINEMYANETTWRNVNSTWLH